MEKYLDFKKEIDYEKLEKASICIKNGGIVVFPTETVYGIGVNGFDEKAIENLYKVKQRPKEKPINLLVNGFEMIEQVAEDITDMERKIIESFCPGPITIILNKKSTVPNLVTAGGSTVGVRIPANEIAISLINYAGCPIATPSANISGKPSGTNIQSIMNDFKENVDFYIDGGESKIGKPSTIIHVIDGIPHILRQGSITKEEIEKVTGKKAIIDN